jgi:hypothetical protein
MANSIYPNEQYIVLDTIQAAAADLSVANGVYKIGNPLQTVCTFKDIVDAKIQAPVAETLQVTTITPTAAANSTYAFYITQWDPSNGGGMRAWFYSYETAASGDTATTIGNYFRTAINADTTIHIAATGTTTLILTAEAGYPIFYVGVTSVGGGFAAVTGTPGVAAINTVAMLTAAGFAGLTGTTYTTVKLNVNQKTGFLLKNQETQYTTWDILISQGATNRAALVTALTETLGNLVISGVTASIENEALV